jgi:phage shock protein A
LARRAIARQLDHQQSLCSIDEQLAEARETNASLRRQLDSLRDEHAAAQSRMTTLVAGQAAADARRHVGVSTSAGLGSAHALGRFEHYCRKLELAEAEAAALVDLDTLGEDAIERELAEREREKKIDHELARLRAAP